MTSRNDEGFTLIELLMTMVLVGLVTVALGSAFAGFVHNTDATTRRLSESHDAQISGTYFAQDVASIGLRDSAGALVQSVDTSTKPPGFLACGTVGTSVVRLAWDEATNATDSRQIRISYVVVQTPAGERQLHRLECIGSAIAISDVVLAHNLAPTGPAVTCGGASCTDAAVPQTVTMVLDIKNPADPGPVYQVILAGQRRQTA